MPGSASANSFGTGQTPVDPLAAALLRSALADQPMTSPWQLAGRLAQFGVGTWIDQSERDSQRKEAADFWNNAPGLKSDAAPAVPAAPAIPGVSAPPRPAAAPADASASPTRALLVEAAKTVGVDPNYVVRIAGQESAFNPNAKSDTGALGLGQFMPATWKTYIAKYGPAYGYGPDTPATDPKANALMTAHYTKDSQQAFKAQYGRDPGPGELYAMHFLGQGGAAKVFAANDQDTMDRVMPDIYRSSPTNKAAMSDRSGQPLTVAAFKQRLNQIAGGPQLAQAAPPTGAVPAGDAPAPPPAGAAVDLMRQPGAIPPEVVAQIRRGLASKNPQVQAAAKQLYMQYAQPDKLTDEMREYALAQRQGETRSFTAWKKDLKAPLVTIDNRGQNEFEKTRGANAAKAVEELRQGSATATAAMPTIDRMGKLLDAVTTGPLAGTQLTWSRVANALGIDVGTLGLKPDQIANAEELKALTISQLTAIAKSLGANPSNYDAQLLGQQVVNFGNSVAGNKQILETARRAARFNQIYAAEAAKWAGKNHHLDGFDDYFREKYPNGVPMPDGKTRTEAPADAAPTATPPPAPPPPGPPNPANLVPPPPGKNVYERPKHVPEGSILRKGTDGNVYWVSPDGKGAWPAQRSAPQ